MAVRYCPATDSGSGRPSFRRLPSAAQLRSEVLKSWRANAMNQK